MIISTEIPEIKTLLLSVVIRVFPLVALGLLLWLFLLLFIRDEERQLNKSNHALIVAGKLLETGQRTAFLGTLVHSGGAGQRNKLRPTSNLRGGVGQSSGPSSNTPAAEISVPYVPPEGKLDITPKNQDEVLADLINVKVVNKGICLCPGIQGAWVPGQGLGIGLDLKFYYYEHAGLNFGFIGLTGNRLEIYPTATVSFHLDYFTPNLKNTEVFAGYAFAAPAPYIVGLRISL